MTVAHVKNWKQFQHYKNRNPPWVKLHKGLLDDFEFSRLHIASKALAPLVWLLASESNDGTFEADAERLAFRLRWNVEDVRVGLSGLIERGFVICASDALADCKQVARPETERELEKELKEHVPQATRFSDFWAVYPIKRAKKSAEAKWKQKRLDAKADELIADVKRRVRDDQQWRDGFAPHAATYLHQERWTDELAGRKQQSVPSTPSPSCHLPANIERTTPEEREARRKAGEENIKKIEAMLPAMRVNA